MLKYNSTGKNYHNVQSLKSFNVEIKIIYLHIFLFTTLSFLYYKLLYLSL